MRGRGRKARADGKIAQAIAFVVFGQRFDDRERAIDRLNAAIPGFGIIVGAGFRFRLSSPDHVLFHRDLAFVSQTKR